MFPSQPLNPTPFQKTVASRLRNRPFLYFGVPFLSIVVLASYGLQGFTKTRYDYHDTKVQTVSRCDEGWSSCKRVTSKVGADDHQLRSCLSRLDHLPSIAMRTTGSSTDNEGRRAQDEQRKEEARFTGRILCEQPACSPIIFLAKRLPLSCSQRLQNLGIGSDEYDIVRVARPAGVPEWGVDATVKSTSSAANSEPRARLV
jgi:cytochrome c oxidase assembly protein subunit 16